MAAIMLVGYRFVVGTDVPAARSEFVFDFYLFLENIQRDPVLLNPPSLRAKRILSCSLLDVDVASITDAQSTDLSSRDRPLRCRLRLVFKFKLRASAEEAVLYRRISFIACEPSTNQFQASSLEYDGPHFEISIATARR
jgi:hypothetical protein